MYLRNVQRTQGISISSCANGTVVRRWCRRRAAADGRDSSAARIRSNRKFHPLLGWENAPRYVLDWLSSKWIHRVVQNAGLAPRNETECPQSLPPAGEEEAAREGEGVGGGWGDAATDATPKPGGCGGATTSVSLRWGWKQRRSPRRCCYQFRTLHPAIVGTGLGVRTRRGIPGFELVPPTRSIAPVRPPPRDKLALFSPSQAS